MNKKIISAALLMAMSSTQVMADKPADKESKGSMFDGHKRMLQAQCIRMDDPEGLFDGKFLGAVFEQAGSSDMFRFKSSYLLSDEEMEACKVAADEMPEFKIKDDDDLEDHEYEHGDEDDHEEYERDGDDQKENESDRRNDKAER